MYMYMHMYMRMYKYMDMSMRIKQLRSWELLLLHGNPEAEEGSRYPGTKGANYTARLLAPSL